MHGRAIFFTMASAMERSVSISPPLSGLSSEKVARFCSSWSAFDIPERTTVTPGIDLETGLKAESPREAITVFVTNTVNRRAAVSHLLASPHGSDFLQLMQKTVKTYLWEMFGRMFPNSRLSVADTEAVLDFFTGGITGLIIGNYSKRNLDTDALVDQIDRLLSGEMRAALLGREFSAGAQ